MKKFLTATVLIILVLVIIAGVALLMMPAGPVTSWIAQKIEESTGRTFKVQGATSLKLLPSIVWRVENVALSNTPGLQGDPLLRAGAIEVRGQLPSTLWSYLSQ